MFIHWLSSRGLVVRIGRKQTHGREKAAAPNQREEAAYMRHSRITLIAVAVM